MTHSEQQIDQVNNRKRTAMNELADMYLILGWKDFLEYVSNALPMLLDKEKDQIINAYNKAAYWITRTRIYIYSYFLLT